MNGLALACVALVIAVSAVALFARLVKHVKVDEQRWIVNSLLVGAAALAVLALTGEPGVLGGILAGFVLALSTVFFGLLALSGQSKQQPVIRVGAPIVDFTAPDHTGEPFTLSSLNGKPILMKFFRGHW
ncbi:MAG: hypothetical protein VX246_13910 [Myxococcota bacterium]|nr:hypothetical protein [Myxococcota bacterium]